MRRNPLVAGIAVAIGLAVLTVGVVVPRGREVMSLEAQVRRADAEAASLAVQLAMLQAVQPADVQAELLAVRAQVPSTSALPELLRSLTDAVDAAKVEVTGFSFAAGSTAVGAPISAIAVTFTATGDYFALARFLFELEHLDRLTRISSISITSGEGKGLSMAVTAEVYTTDPSVGPGSDPAVGPEVGA